MIEYLYLCSKKNMDIRIKELLKERSMTSKELAELVGVSEQTISYTANGKVCPSINTLKKIANALKIPFWHLFINPDKVTGKKEDTAHSVIIDGIEYVPKK